MELICMTQQVIGNDVANQVQNVSANIATGTNMADRLGDLLTSVAATTLGAGSIVGAAESTNADFVATLAQGPPTNDDMDLIYDGGATAGISELSNADVVNQVVGNAGVAINVNQVVNDGGNYGNYAVETQSVQDAIQDATSSLVETTAGLAAGAPSAATFMSENAATNFGNSASSVADIANVSADIGEGGIVNTFSVTTPADNSITTIPAVASPISSPDDSFVLQPYTTSSYYGNMNNNYGSGEIASNQLLNAAQEVEQNAVETAVQNGTFGGGNFATAVGNFTGSTSSGYYIPTMSPIPEGSPDSYISSAMQTPQSYLNMGADMGGSVASLEGSPDAITDIQTFANTATDATSLNMAEAMHGESAGAAANTATVDYYGPYASDANNLNSLEDSNLVNTDATNDAIQLIRNYERYVQTQLMQHNGAVILGENEKLDDVGNYVINTHVTNSETWQSSSSSKAGGGNTNTGTSGGTNTEAAPAGGKAEDVVTGGGDDVLPNIEGGGSNSGDKLSEERKSSSTSVHNTGAAGTSIGIMRHHYTVNENHDLTTMSRQFFERLQFSLGGGKMLTPMAVPIAKNINEKMTMSRKSSKVSVSSIAGASQIDEKDFCNEHRADEHTDNTAPMTDIVTRITPITVSSSVTTTASSSKDHNLVVTSVDPASVSKESTQTVLDTVDTVVNKKDDTNDDATAAMIQNNDNRRCTRSRPTLKMINSTERTYAIDDVIIRTPQSYAMTGSGTNDQVPENNEDRGICQQSVGSLKSLKVKGCVNSVISAREEKGSDNSSPQSYSSFNKAETKDLLVPLLPVSFNSVSNDIVVGKSSTENIDQDALPIDTHARGNNNSSFEEENECIGENNNSSLEASRMYKSSVIYKLDQDSDEYVSDGSIDIADRNIDESIAIDISRVDVLTNKSCCDHVESLDFTLKDSRETGSVSFYNNTSSKNYYRGVSSSYYFDEKVFSQTPLVDGLNSGSSDIHVIVIDKNQKRNRKNTSSSSRIMELEKSNCRYMSDTPTNNGCENVPALLHADSVEIENIVDKISMGEEKELETSINNDLHNKKNNSFNTGSCKSENENHENNVANYNSTNNSRFQAAISARFAEVTISRFKKAIEISELKKELKNIVSIEYSSLNDSSFDNSSLLESSSRFFDKASFDNANQSRLVNSGHGKQGKREDHHVSFPGRKKTRPGLKRCDDSEQPSEASWIAQKAIMENTMKELMLNGTAAGSMENNFNHSNDSICEVGAKDIGTLRDSQDHSDDESDQHVVHDNEENNDTDHYTNRWNKFRAGVEILKNENGDTCEIDYENRRVVIVKGGGMFSENDDDAGHGENPLNATIKCSLPRGQHSPQISPQISPREQHCQHNEDMINLDSLSRKLSQSPCNNNSKDSVSSSSSLDFASRRNPSKSPSGKSADSALREFVPFGGDYRYYDYKNKTKNANRNPQKPKRKGSKDGKTKTKDNRSDSAYDNSSTSNNTRSSRASRESRETIKSSASRLVDVRISTQNGKKRDRVRAKNSAPGTALAPTANTSTAQLEMIPPSPASTNNTGTTSRKNYNRPVYLISGNTGGASKPPIRCLNDRKRQKDDVKTP